MLYSNSLKHFSVVQARLHVKFVIILAFVWTDIIIHNKYRKNQSSSDFPVFFIDFYERVCAQQSSRIH